MAMETRDFAKIINELSLSLPTSRSEFSVDEVETTIVGASYLHQFHLAIDHAYASRWKECVAICKMLLDITWEKLNTGHWKDVSLAWRKAYSFLSLLKALSEFAQVCEGDTKVSLATAIRTCDMGLLMGAPVLGNVLNSVVDALQQKWVLQNTPVEYSKEATECFVKDMPVISPDKAIPVESCLSITDFHLRYFTCERAVVIRDAMDSWPCMSSRRWSVDYIRRLAGCRTVPVELGSKYTEESWSQTLMTVDEFITQYIESPKVDKVGYLAQHQLFNQIPQLENDIVIPSYCAIGDQEDVDMNAWFGPCGTVSPLHQDPKHNFLAQVMGKKYVRLYSVEHTPQLYPHTTSLLCNTSQVDVENPDHAKFPNFSKAPYLECILEPGDMLYIPPKMWHYIRSLSVSFSVSFWWE